MPHAMRVFHEIGNVFFFWKYLIINGFSIDKRRKMEIYTKILIFEEKKYYLLQIFWIYKNSFWNRQEGASFYKFFEVASNKFE